jgi:hypothetical protein
MNSLMKFLGKLGVLKEDLDYHLLRASMVVVFLFFGYQKWFQYEAQALIPYISHGPRVMSSVSTIRAARAAEHRKIALLSRDAHSDPRFKQFALLLEEKFQALLSVPLISREEMLGVLNVHHQKVAADWQTEESAGDHDEFLQDRIGNFSDCFKCCVQGRIDAQCAHTTVGFRGAFASPWISALTSSYTTFYRSHP